MQLIEKRKSSRWVLVGGGTAIVILLAVLVWPSGTNPQAMLRSRNPLTRMKAIDMIARAPTAKALRAVAVHVHDRNAQVACRAIDALGLEAPPDLFSKVMSAIKDSRPEVRAAAIVAAGRRAQAKGSAAHINDQALAQVLVADPAPQVRAAAATALGRAHAWNSFQAMMAALEDPSVEVRGRAAAAVRHMFSGRDPGYHANDPPYEREAAIARIRQLWPGFERNYEAREQQLAHR